MPDLLDIKRSIERMPIDEISSIVRSAVGDELAVATPGWTVEPMSAASLGLGTLGFLKVQGLTGSGNDRVEWDFVVKVLDTSETSYSGASVSFNLPAREVGAFESGFFGRLDGGFQAASCHGITRSGDTTLLWLEDLSDSAQYPWGREEFLIAARHVGFFNGSWPEDRAPTGDWLDRKLITNRPMYFVQAGSYDLMKNAEKAPAVVDMTARSGVKGIGNMYSEFVEITRPLVSLPRTVCHNDFHSRNAFFRREATGPVTYVIDWASVGLGPVGIDGGTLAGGGLVWQEVEARMISDIEHQIFDEYVGGLGDAGFRYDRDQIRLGYLSNFVIYMMNYVVAPLRTERRMWDRLAGRFGVGDDDLMGQLALRLRMFKPQFDEAVVLARQLG